MQEPCPLWPVVPNHLSMETSDAPLLVWRPSCLSTGRPRGPWATKGLPGSLVDFSMWPPTSSSSHHWAIAPGSLRPPIRKPQAKAGDTVRMMAAPLSQEAPPDITGSPSEATRATFYFGRYRQATPPKPDLIQGLRLGSRVWFPALGFLSLAAFFPTSQSHVSWDKSGWPVWGQKKVGSFPDPCQTVCGLGHPVRKRGSPAPRRDHRHPDEAPRN